MTTPPAASDDTPDDTPDDKVATLLARWSGGDRASLDALLPLVYGELQRLAERALYRERNNHTLQRTALVHEAFLRLVKQRDSDLQNRSQFFGLAAQMMRRILVDHARARRASKRGDGVVPISLNQTGIYFEARADDTAPSSALDVAANEDVDLGAIDDALNRLAELDPRQAQIVEMRFFGGLSIEETAEGVGISPATVKREWVLARAWLGRELSTDRP